MKPLITGTLIFSFVFFCAVSVSGQKINIYGKITDKRTKEALPYATIRLKDTILSTMAEVDGTYKFEANIASGSIMVSMVGYETQTLEVKASGADQKIDFALKEDLYIIETLAFNPSNEANALMRKVVANKIRNNTTEMPNWTSRLYSKIEIDLKNVKRPEKDNKLWRQIDFIFDNIDTLESDGRTYLPIFITETMSDYYHIKNGNNHEIIRASKVSGASTGMVSEFTGQLHSEVEPYSNYIRVANISIISPLNDNGHVFYRYFINDSTYANGQKIYEMAFYPKQKMDPTFKGLMWIADSTFALTGIEMKLSEAANVNFLKELVYERKYKLQDTVWIPDSEALWIDFNLQKNKSEKLIGLIGRKSTVYNDFRFSETPNTVLRQKKPVTVLNDAMKYNAVEWDSIRPVGLQAREAAIYGMVDSLKNVPIVRTVFDYIEMFFFGYKDFGYVEMGPYYNMYSTNEVEGNRFRLGGRTTMKFHEKLRLDGYAAYGTKDEDFKYGFGGQYFFSKDPCFLIEVQHEHDYRLLGRSHNAFSEDNIMNSMLSRNSISKLNMIDRYTLKINKEWEGAFSNTLMLNHEKIHSAPYVPFFDNNMAEIPSIKNTTLTFNTRMAIREKMILGNYEKMRFGSIYPIVNLSATTAINGLGGNYDYLSLNLDIYDHLPISPLGYMSYHIQAGHLWGNTPFPFLFIHAGNETYVMNRQAYNLMNYHEHISDRYASIALEQHFQGFFFNRIPLVRKLKWRELAGIKCLVGDISESRHNALMLPEGMSSLNGKPYLEMNLGIENIFRLLRVDGIWRLTDNNAVLYDKFSVFISLQFTL